MNQILWTNFGIGWVRRFKNLSATGTVPVQSIVISECNKETLPSATYCLYVCKYDHVSFFTIGHRIIIQFRERFFFFFK